MTDPASPRPGEIALAQDPAAADPDAGLVFIGRLRTPWSRGDCPRNLRQARERGGAFALEIDAPYRPGLSALSAGDWIWALYWMAGARRDLIVQTPRHSAGPRGVFSLRSPARPNPVAMAAARLLSLDAEAGRLELDALDAFDGTPLLDVKPWLPAVDAPEGAA
ncbi:MAG: TrmO family methyltransferase [Pseudomonadota bacterium]